MKLYRLYRQVFALATLTLAAAGAQAAAPVVGTWYATPAMPGYPSTYYLSLPEACAAALPAWQSTIGAQLTTAPVGPASCALNTLPDGAQYSVWTAAVYNGAMCANHSGLPDTKLPFELQCSDGPVGAIPIEAERMPWHHPGNFGPHCIDCGDTINPATGNMAQVERDYAVVTPGSGLLLQRTYNSSPYNWDAKLVRSFGARWTQPYDAVLKPEGSWPLGTTPGSCWRNVTTQAESCQGPAAPVAGQLPPAVSILRGDGKKYLFRGDGGPLFRGETNAMEMVIAENVGSGAMRWTYRSAQDGVTEVYNENGLLISITARGGATQRLTYSDGLTFGGHIPLDAPPCLPLDSAGPNGPLIPAAGKLTCVTDQWNRTLRFGYDAKGRIVAAMDPSQRIYAYEYDGPSGGCLPGGPAMAACSANNLTKVTYPDGSSRTYFYDEAAHVGTVGCAGPVPFEPGAGRLPNAMTGLVNERGIRQFNWNYDCAGRATASWLGDEYNRLNQVTLENHARFATTVMRQTGSGSSLPSEYFVADVLGVAKPMHSETWCQDCAIQFTYDQNGDVATSWDRNGNQTCYTHDPMTHLETARVEGAGDACGSALNGGALAAPGRKISTAWHPRYVLPIQVAEPKKRTSYGYDEQGKLLSITEQATNDPTGAQGFSAAPQGLPRTRNFTYNQWGQVATVQGPRTDIASLVRYDYDDRGNLVAAFDGAGQLSVYGGHDPDGRARTKSEQGRQTDYAYTVRGWLESRAIRLAAGPAYTSFQYEPTGQLRAVRRADGSYTQYVYDPAQRLVGIEDSRGSVHYELDQVGNRVEDIVSARDGTPLRRIRRTYDSQNRLQQQTGASQ